MQQALCVDMVWKKESGLLLYPPFDTEPDKTKQCQSWWEMIWPT
jgi:hypothetical protein